MRELVGRLFGRTETALAVVIAAFALVFSLAAPQFLTLANWLDLVESNSVTFILAAGVLVVLVSGGIDVSFAATASASQYVAAYLAARHGLSPLPAIAVACALGAAMGAVNALLTHGLRVVSIIVTIATSSVYYALLLVLTDGKEIYDLPDWWTRRVTFLQLTLASGETLRVTLPVVVMLVRDISR
jgi:simple sugar transport system permease protein